MPDPDPRPSEGGEDKAAHTPSDSGAKHERSFEPKARKTDVPGPHDRLGPAGDPAEGKP
jgi:hypothetical protein